jgi:ketosteroid isomerase-like protein
VPAVSHFGFADFPADRAQEVHATKIAFAKAVAERDAKRFFSYLADDAQFLGRHNIICPLT